MLFTSLAHAFFSDLEDPPATNPLEIILISPMGALLPLVSSSLFSHPSVVIYTAPTFVQTSVISLYGLRFLLGVSDVCIR